MRVVGASPAAEEGKERADDHYFDALASGPWHAAFGAGPRAMLHRERSAPKSKGSSSVQRTVFWGGEGERVAASPALSSAPLSLG